MAALVGSGAGGGGSRGAVPAGLRALYEGEGGGKGCAPGSAPQSAALLVVQAIVGTDYRRNPTDAQQIECCLVRFVCASRICGLSCEARGGGEEGARERRGIEGVDG